MLELDDHSTLLSVLNHAPLWIYIQQESNITWVNRQLAADMQLTTEEKATPSIAHEKLASVQENAPTLFIKTPSDQQHWFRQHVVALSDSVSVHYLTLIDNEIALAEEKRELAEKLSVLDVRDPVTGLSNRQATLQHLDSQITRSRRYGNPLSVLRLTLDFEEGTDSMEVTEITRNMAQCLRDKLRWADKIGVIESSVFLIVLPETPLSSAKELAGKLANDRATFPSQDRICRFQFGVAEWEKGDDRKKILAKLENNLELNVSALLS